KRTSAGSAPGSARSSPGAVAPDPWQASARQADGGVGTVRPGASKAMQRAPRGGRRPTIRAARRRHHWGKPVGSAGAGPQQLAQFGLVGGVQAAFALL